MSVSYSPLKGGKMKIHKLRATPKCPECKSIISVMPIVTACSSSPDWGCRYCPANKYKTYYWWDKNK
jgi:hypothetical protein